MKRYLLIVLVLFVGLTLSAQEKLKPEEADSLILKYAQEEEALQSQLDGLNSEIEVLNEEIAGLQAEIDRLQGRKSEILSKLEEKKYYIVKAGDWLSKLAEYPEVYGHGKYHLWKKIYNANTSKIKDPDLILPGWKLLVPPIK